MWSKQKLEIHLSVLWTNLLLLKNTSLIEQNCQKKQVWSRVIKLVHKLKKKGILKLLFWNAVKDLNIPEYQNAGHRADIFLYPVLKTIIKHRIHPSVIAIESSIMDLHLIFHVSVEAAQSTDIPVKILKNSDSSAEYICEFSTSLDITTFK